VRERAGSDRRRVVRNEEAKEKKGETLLVLQGE
jgi:hypothetical protein